MTEIDNSYQEAGEPFRRFYLRRLKDETGISRTGRVLEGVLTQSGKVFVEWRPPHSTMGIYNSFEEFEIIHVDCHPSCNEVVWLDASMAWYRGTRDCAQDACENAPFASVGGPERRSDMIAPGYVQPEDASDYLDGYRASALELYGVDWQTCGFAWGPAITIPASE